MNVLVIIRVCPNDDFIAHLCYESFKEVMKEHNLTFMFFAEKGVYKWINQEQGSFVFRKFCGNFGGQEGLYCCIDYLKPVDVNGFDKIILSDSDITLYKDPLDVEVDFGGIMHIGNERHYSGQLLIFSKKVWNHVMNNGNYPEIIKFFVESNVYHVADDTCMSWVAYQSAFHLYDYNGKGYWKHEKLHHLEPLVK